MDDTNVLAEQFEQNRTHLRAVAYRMLGSVSEADDAVQEAWIRLTRADTSDVQNLGGWLTTVVARVCLDMLRSRKSRREEPLDGVDGTRREAEPGGDAAARPHAPLRPSTPPEPEHEAVLADSVGLALLVVLETLTPAERLSFVLHDMFAVPFDEIAPIVGCSPVAARQLASRARRRVQGTDGVPEVDATRQRAVVDAFLAASRRGDFDALLALLDPDVVLRADRAAVQTGADAEVRGAAGVAATFAGRAQGARLALIDGSAGAVWSQGSRPRVVFAFTVRNGRVVEIELLADPAYLDQMELVLLDRER
jgi:RNA polymerase sigma-70 factor (ECF subfamily)